jgi:ubiquinone/menaquinone biosynthesis C-methylase UbiE
MQSNIKHSVAKVRPTYFELQAYWGATKHMGGMRTTRELIELCHIRTGAYVLDVGCGVGATPVYLAKKLDCRVVGIDIADAMIARAQQKVEREHVEDHVELRAANAQNLPFDDALFDAVIAESVITFIPDKARAISECARVTKPSGFVGLNEEIWVKPPTPELVEYAKHAWDIHAEILTCEGWRQLLECAGLQDVSARTYQFNASFGEYISEISRYSFREYLIMFSRAIALYAKNPAFRQYVKGRYSSLPKSFFKYLGYGIFAGRK